MLSGTEEISSTMNAAFKLIKVIMFPKLRRFMKVAFNSKYLLYTNLGISMSLAGAGDILEQNYEILTEENKKWDPVRTNHMTMSGLTGGILAHYWYRFLDTRMPGKTVQLVVKKVVLDLVVCSPLIIATFFATIAILEGSSYATFKAECKQKGWRLYLADWIVGPPVQFINYYFLPPRFRVLYDSTISLGEDIYTSYVKHAIPLELADDK